MTPGRRGQGAQSFALKWGEPTGRTAQSTAAPHQGVARKQRQETGPTPEAGSTKRRTAQNEARGGANPPGRTGTPQRPPAGQATA